MNDGKRRDGDGSAFETVAKLKDDPDRRGVSLEVWINDAGLPTAAMKPIGRGLPPKDGAVALAYSIFGIAETLGIDSEDLVDAVMDIKEQTASVSDSTVGMGEPN